MCHTGINGYTMRLNLDDHYFPLELKKLKLLFSTPSQAKISEHFNNMPQQNSTSKFPLAWSSKLTVQYMRRLGLVTPIDDALIDQAATDFVSNSNTKPPSKHVLSNTATQHVYENAPVSGAALDYGPCVETRRSKGEGSTFCQNDKTPENATHLGPCLHDDSESISKNHCEGGAKACAISVNHSRTTQLTVKPIDNLRKESMGNKPKHDDVEGVIKKESGDTIRVTEMLESDSGGHDEMAIRREFSKGTVKPLMPEISEKEKKESLISLELDDIGYDADTEGSTVEDQALIAGPMPPFAEGMMDHDLTDNA